MLMETLYNLDKNASAEPSLKRNIVPDSKNTEKFMALLWKPRLKPLCGTRHSLLSLKELVVKYAFAKTVFTNFEIVISRGIFFSNAIKHFG